MLECSCQITTIIQLPIGNQIMCYFMKNYLLVTKSCDNSCMYIAVYMFVEICCKPIVCVIRYVVQDPTFVTASSRVGYPG